MCCYAAGPFAKAESFDHVLLLSRRQDLLDLVASEVSAACGGECGVSTLATDVTSDEDVAAAFALARSLGRVECVVFNVVISVCGGVSVYNAGFSRFKHENHSVRDLSILV